jgi:hypothetical protein
MDTLDDGDQGPPKKTQRLASSSATRPSRARASKEESKRPRDPEDLDRVLVKFSRLEMASLKRYQQYFGLDLPLSDPNKDQLIGAVSMHFVMAPKLKEIEVVSNFLNHVWNKNEDRRRRKRQALMQ